MKSKLLLWLLLLYSGSAWAQLPVIESFESDGDGGVRYTSTTATNTVSATRYFIRAQNNVPGFGNPAGSVAMGNVDGTYFWACEGVRGTSANSTSTTTAGTLTLNPISNTQSYTNLKVTIAAGSARDATTNVAAIDHLRVQYRYGSPTGNYTVAGEFTRDPALTSGNSPWTRVGGSGPATLPTAAFADYVFDVAAGTGDLYVQIEADYYGSNKEIAFDNIRVTGTASTVAKPTIASNNGTGTLTFAEGTATSLPIFPSLTLTNPAMSSNPTLSGATVTIATGYAGTEDVLTYTIPTGSGITLTSNTNGVLTFSGTASVANYETLLESVKYQDTEVNNATAGDRKLSFVVKSTVDSAPLERIITVTTALNAASPLNYTENFDTDGEGTRYGSNTRVANSQGFVRLTNASGGSATAGSGFSNGNITFTNVQGSGYWYSNGANGNVSGNVARLTLAPVNSTGFVNLHFKVKAGAASSANSFYAGDFLRFAYSNDGGANFTVFANYTGNNGFLYLDGNPANPALSSTLADLDFTLPTSLGGTAIQFRVESASGGGEPIVFDYIQITGTQLAAPTVATGTASSLTTTTASISGNTLTSDGGASLTGYGVVYVAGTGTPTTANLVVTVGTSSPGTFPANFTAGLTGLTAGTQYTARAYATNSVGTSYGANVSFTTAAPTITVSPATLASGTVAAAYSQTITASGGTSPYTYAITAGALPAGLTLSSAGVLAGTPTAGGTFNFTVRATDASTGGGPYSGSRAYSLAIAVPTIAVSPATLPNGATGTAYTQAITASGGTAPYSFAITAGALPTGLSLLSGGTLAGTPTASGTFNFTVTATDASAGTGPYSGSRAYTVSIVTTLAASAQNATVQLNANGTATLNASSVNNGSTGPGTLTYTIQKIAFGLVPEGQTLTLTTANGANFTQIRFASYGTPVDNNNGNYRLGSCNAANSVVTAQNSFLGRSTGSMDAANGPNAANNNPQLGDPCGGTAKQLAVQAGYSADAASLTYACTEAGKTQYVLLTVTDGNGNTSTSVAQVTVNAPPTATITSVSPNSGNIGAIITVSGTNLGGATAAGVMVNGTAVAALLNASGTSFQFQVPGGASLGAGSVVVTLPCGQTLTNAFTVTQPTTAAPAITAPTNGTLTNNPSVTISGTAPANSQVLVYFSQGGTPVSGSPIAATAAANGTFSLGAVTFSDGTYQAYATAQTAGSSVSTNSGTITFTVDATRPSVVISSTAGATGGTTGTSPIPFTVTFSEAVTGFVAGDVTVTNGTITGNVVNGSGTTYSFTVTPTTAGTATAVNVPAAVAQDAAGNFNTATPAAYALTFMAPIVTLPPATLPGGTVAVAYSQTIIASGGMAPYTYAITSGALPTGLMLTSGGVLAGTPTVGGSFTFTVTVTDASTGSGPYTGSRSYTISTATPATIAWTGSVSTDWFNASNWSPALVPTASSDVTIPNGTVRSPLIATNAQTAATRSLTLNAGATLSMMDNTLDVQGNLTNNGTFAATGGTVALGTVFQANGPNILGSSTIRFWNLTVQTNGLLLSTSAGTSVQRVLTLNGALVTQSNPLTIESNSTGTGLVVNNGNNDIIGSVTVQRYISPDLNAGPGYRHFSTPVGFATVGSLATGSFTPVVNSGYNSSAAPGTVTPFPTVYGYDQSRLASVTNNLSAFDKGWFSPTALNDPLTVGQGYTVNLAAGQSFSVTGPQNNAASQPISLSLTRAAPASLNGTNAGWQLVGNPFPSPLDYSLVVPADRINLDAAIYINESTSQYSGNYRFYVNGIGGDPILALGQGFFARVSTGQTSGTLNFRNSQRVTAYQNPVYHRTAAESRPLVQLTLNGASLTDNAYVYFENGATDAFDAQYDALKLPNTTGLNLSSGSTGQDLSIDGRSVLGTAQRIVPLLVGVPTPGNYSFNAAQLLNLNTVPVYLRDLLTGAVIDLRLQPSYQFTVSNASVLVTGRFELVFSPQQALATVPSSLAAQVAVYPNPAKSTSAVAIELPAALARQAMTAELVDVLGRVVRTQVLPMTQATHSLLLADIATGIYSLRLTTNIGVMVKKLVVE